MRKFYIHFLLLLSPSCVFGQDTSAVHNGALFGDAPTIESKPVTLSVGGAWFGQSNELNLGFIKKVVLGGTLDNISNQDIFSSLVRRNQLMGHQQFGFQLKSALDSSSILPNGFFCVQWQKSSWNQLVFSKDVFGLALLGNAPFVGKELDLSQSSFTQISFQKIGLGFQSKEHGWSIYLNGIEGKDFYQFKIKKGDVLTDPSGAFIDLNYRLTQIQAPQQNSGVGMGLDFQWQKKIGKVKWNWQLSDLGWIKFREIEKLVWQGNDTYTGLSWSNAILNGTQADEELNTWTESQKSMIDKNVFLPTKLSADVVVGTIGYRVITYCFERQLGWQTLYFSKHNVPIKFGQMHYELALNHTFNDRYALSGELGFVNKKENLNLSIMASELPGFLMSNSRQLMCQVNVQKRIF